MNWNLSRFCLACVVVFLVCLVVVFVFCLFLFFVCFGVLFLFPFVLKCAKGTKQIQTTKHAKHAKVSFNILANILARILNLQINLR